MAITDDQITKLEKLLEESTDGPWEAGCCGERIITAYRDEHGNMTKENYLHGGWGKVVAKVTHPKWKKTFGAYNDLKLLVEMRKVMPELLAEIKELRQAN